MTSPQADLQSRLKDALLALQKMRSRLETLEKARQEPIAIVGMGCRFPANVNTPEQFWQFLRASGDAMTDIPLSRWDIDQYYDPDPDAPGKVGTRQAALIEQPIDRFDAAFFGISPREARSMDPQQRMLLEVAWETLEHAGIAPGQAANSRTGVYVGMTMQDFLLIQANRLDSSQVDAYHTTGGVLNAAVGRVSYLLGLRGPCMVVDTACSSSLVAVHLAVQALRSGECDLALAGGVNAILSPAMMISLTKAHMLAPDGRCKTFDARANGFARGEGCGLVALKRLSAALADGDRVFAVIRGSAVNHGGISSGFTVPNKLAQAALVRDALKNAGVLPSQVSYVEAHGTGTSLGDPIEIRALVDALHDGRAPDNPLLLGSVKTNFGHLEAAAGIIGLMKLALAAYHAEIPPHLHFETPNPYIPWDEMPLHVPTAPTPWQGPRIGGVSSFGASGTNGHVIVEAGPEPAPVAEDAPGRAYLLTISAQTETALRAYADAWYGFLTQADVPALRDVTYTANTRRTAFDWRLSVTGQTPVDMAEALAAYISDVPRAGTLAARRAAGVPHKLAFVFSGQGPQWWGMGRELLAQEPVFRERIEACDALLRPYTGWSLLDELARPEAESRLDETAIAQPAIFAVQIALAALWRSWGVVPGAVVGHSVGEIAAAHVAGVLNLEDAVRVVFHRARLMQHATGQGKMMVVELPEAEAEALIAPFAGRLTVGAVNSPVSTVLSGEAEALEAAAALVAEQGIFHRVMPVNYAFHSPQMEPYRHELAHELAGLRPEQARLLLMSTVTGTRSDGSDYTADYWGRNVRQPVRFAPAVMALADQGYDTFLEIAPHPVLASVIEQCLAAGEHTGLALHSLRRHKDERATMLAALGALHAQGSVTVNWEALYPEQGAVVSLPPYPWQRERHWVDLPAAGRRAAVAGSAGALLGQRLRSPGIEHAIFEAQFDPQQPAFAADHRVLGAVILSGTTYLELVAEAALAQGMHPFALTDFLVQTPLALSDDEARTVQVITRPGAVEIYSLQNDAWTQHAAGTIAPVAADERLLPETDWEAVRERCAHEAQADELYAAAAARGLDFGPAFRGLERLWLGEGEALGLVRAPEGRAEDYQFHPAQLDACFHPILALLAASDMGTFLPVSYGAVRYHARPAGAVYAHTRLRQVEADTCLADVCVWDEQGMLVAEVRGLRFRSVSAATAAHMFDWLYEVRWLPAAPVPAEGASVDRSGWLIFADAHGVGTALAQRLAAAGASTQLVTPGPALADLGGGWWQLDPQNGAHYREVLQAAQAEAGPALRGIVHLWSLDAPAGSASASQELAAASALLLAQAVAGAGGGAELWLVTRGAQAVAGALANPAQAAVWGFGAALALEQPELTVTCLDLDPDDAAGDRALFDEIAHGAHDEPRVAFRQQTRFVARLERSRESADAALLDGDQPFMLDITERGVLDNLAFRAAERRAPGPDDIEIRVHATGLNFRDVLNALGMYPGDAGPLGNECAGEVVAVGARVQHVQVGDRVMGIAYGTFSRHVTTPAALAIRIPPLLSYEEAATIPVTFLTALYGLQHLAGMKAGDRVLIHSAAGGVGMAAVQLALRTGAEVFGTAGSPAKRDFLARLGVQHRLNSRTLDFADEIAAQTAGSGVNIVLNALTGDFIPASLSALGSGGHFLEIGRAGIWDAAQMQAARQDVRYDVIYLGDVCQHQPDLIQAMLREIVGGLEDGSLTPLPLTVFPLREAVDAFRYMAQARHIGKVVLSQDARRGQIVADATYLVTGGASGIGLHVARWLVQQGARHLVLASRRGETDDALALAREAADDGVDVRLAACDVSEPEAVWGLFERVLGDMPPLRGIVHCAGVNVDAPLLQQDAERLAAVMRPKADGALLLAEAARDVELDFFLLFSSIASVIGSYGQSNYAAANACLDALAHALRAQGVPATSINWGIWENTGMTAVLSEQDRARWARQGLQSFSAEQGISLLAHILAAAPTQIAVMPVNWRRFLQERASPLYAAFASAAPVQAQAGAPPALLARLKSAPASRQRGILVQFVRDQAVMVLGLDAAQTIDPLLPLSQLGLDSLMAVELRNALALNAGLTLPATLLFDYPTIGALVDYLLGRLDAAQPSVTQAEPADNHAAADDVAGLSDEEAEALLLQELDQVEKKRNRR